MNVKRLAILLFSRFESLSVYAVTVQCQHTGMVQKVLAQFASQTTYYLLATSPQEKLCLTCCYSYSMLAYLLFSNKENVWNIH